MTAKRILLIGDFGRSGLGAPYYNTNFALHAGFVRAGCHVWPFSDRDTAREASLFGRKSLGRSTMNKTLLKTAETYKPHLVLFGHADMTGPETFDALRHRLPGVRLAQFNVDALFRSATMARFRDRAEHVDLSFITTAAPDRLRAIGAPRETLAYFPNPVDTAISVRDLSLVARADAAFDGIFLGTNIERREEQVDALTRHLPQAFRFYAGGGVRGTTRLIGPSYLETLAGATMSPSLSLDHTVPADFLYASDRLAHLLCHGIVPFCPVEAGLEAIYEDGIVAYSDLEDLAGKMAALMQDDARRREIAAKGRRLGVERTGADHVARYMLDMVFGDGPTRDYGWPSERI